MNIYEGVVLVEGNDAFSGKCTVLSYYLNKTAYAAFTPSEDYLLQNQSYFLINCFIQSKCSVEEATFQES